jgi:pyruvate dehydrogenase E1 component alpha subunit
MGSVTGLPTVGIGPLDEREPPRDALAQAPTLEPWSLLAPDGSVPDGYEPSLNDGDLLAIFRRMLLSRAIDERSVSLQRQGRLGTVSGVRGQEASVIGTAWALERARDWVVPQYRELPAMLLQGYPLSSYFLYYMGSPSGGAIPDGVNLLPFQISLAAQIPHAVGLAWGLLRQGRDAVTMVYFGDGASSEGDAHEAMNLAGVRRAPVVFVVQNNGWAISTPVTKQTAASSLAVRATAYGFPGVLVDGNDIFATYEAARWAVARARRGAGPTLIENLTYRLGPHNTADDPARYISASELEGRQSLDPVIRLRRFLSARALISDELEGALTAEVAAEVAAAVTDAEGRFPVPREELFEHVYRAPTARLTRQHERHR